MQHLAGVSPGREDRVIAMDAGVAERRALLRPAEGLADEGVDVDDQSPVARSGARRPRALERLTQHAVELADMPERKRAQKRPQRRGRHHTMPEHIGGPARAQQITVIDAVRAQRHRRDQRHHLRALVARADTLAKHDTRVDQRLDPQPLRERPRQDDSGVRDRPLVIERDRDAIQSDRPVNMHHEGDLLSQAATAAIGRFSPAQEVILRSPPDRTGCSAGGSRP